MDFIITVCDSAAGEACPIWPGQPISAHWGFEDPAAAQGSDEEKRRVFEKVFRQISTRIHVFISLPLAALDKARSEEHTSELQSLMRISYAVFCLKKKNKISK